MHRMIACLFFGERSGARQHDRDRTANTSSYLMRYNENRRSLSFEFDERRLQTFDNVFVRFASWISVSLCPSARITSGRAYKFVLCASLVLVWHLLCNLTISQSIAFACIDFIERLQTHCIAIRPVQQDNANSQREASNLWAQGCRLSFGLHVSTLSSTPSTSHSGSPVSFAPSPTLPVRARIHRRVA
jgi:hypothetical protein